MLFFILSATLACGKKDPELTVSPLPQDDLIQVYFNQARSGQYKEPYRELKRTGDNLEQVLVDAILSAQTTIDVAVQEFRLPGIAQALADRHQAGVQIRIILENQYSRPLGDFTTNEIANLSSREKVRHQEFAQLVDKNGDGTVSSAEVEERDALILLQKAGIPLIDDTADASKGSGLMHHKFVVIDRKLVITGSANFTTSGVHGDFINPESRGNPNHLIQINSPTVAQVFTQEFALMWGDGPGNQSNSLFGLQKPSRSAQTVTVGNSTVTIHFSPTSKTQDWLNSSNGLIGSTLSSASQQIDLALFVFSEQPLANILQLRHQQGVQIRALIDSGFAFRNYSEALDMLGVAISQHCKYETGNQPWTNPLTTVGTASLPEGDVLHHKFGVIDGKVVITGSHNWSAAANTQNDETLLIIQNPIIAAHFEREFQRLYQDAILGIPPQVRQKITKDRAECF